MRLDEKSVVSYWHMDENLQIWPEFDSYNPNDLCQFLDMNDFDKVKEELKSLIAKGKFPSTKEAFNAYKDGKVKIKLSEPEPEKSEKIEKETVVPKIEEPSPKEQKNKIVPESTTKKTVKKSSSTAKTKSSPKKTKPKTTKKETKVSVKKN